MRDAYEQYGKPVHMTETSDLNPATVLSYFRFDASSYVLWAQTTDQDGGTLHWTPSKDNNIDWNQVAATTKWPRSAGQSQHPRPRTFRYATSFTNWASSPKYLKAGDVRVESSAPGRRGQQRGLPATGPVTTWRSSATATPPTRRPASCSASSPSS